MIEHLQIFWPAYVWGIIAFVYITGLIECLFHGEWTSTNDANTVFLLFVFFIVDVVIFPPFGFFEFMFGKHSKVAPYIIRFFKRKVI